MQQTSFSQRGCARLLNSLKLFRLSKSRGKKKALSARELNSCTNLPLSRVPWAVCQREVLVHLFNGEDGRKKERHKLSLSFHNWTKCYQLIASNWGGLFTDLEDILLHNFCEFCYISGEKTHIVIKKWGFRLFSCASSICFLYKPEKTISLLPYISLSVLILLVEFSHCLFLFNEKLFIPEAIFSQQTASIVTIFHLFFLPPPLVMICIDRRRWDSRVLPGSGSSPGPQDMPSLPETGQEPSKLSPALPACCWKPVSEQPCSGGWKTSSDFLAMFISDQFIAICSCANSAFCFNSSFPSFVFTSLLYL